MLSAGALLASRRMKDKTRRRTGTALALIGLVTTIPSVMLVVGSAESRK